MENDTTAEAATTADQDDYFASLGGLSTHEWHKLHRQKNYVRLEEILDAETPSLELITDADFDDKVLGVLGPMLVFFSTAGVPGGHRRGVVLEQLARTTPRKIYRMRVETSTATRGRFAVPFIPHIYLFRKGRLLGMYDGEMRPEKIDAWIRSFTSLVYDPSRNSTWIQKYQPIAAAS